MQERDMATFGHEVARENSPRQHPWGGSGPILVVRGGILPHLLVPGWNDTCEKQLDNFGSDERGKDKL